MLVLLGALPSLAQEDPNVAWKNRIVFPGDPFASWTSPAFIKFTIITKAGYDPNVIYFQDSARYEYHYDFALEYLDPFIGMTIEEFDNVTLHKASQQAVLGAVIFPPWHDPPLLQYGIQFVRNDPYTREEIVGLFRQVKSCIIADPNVIAYYFPSYEQYPVAQQNRQWFEEQGVPIGSTAQWVEGNVGYSTGWALGRLVFVSGTSIQAAYTTGQLRSDDLLLTDGVPSEVPSVAGIISLMPSTPNSHVAILARSQGVPFVHLAVQEDAAMAQALVGHEVYLTVNMEGGMSCEVELLDMDGLTDEDKSALTKLKQSPPLVIHPVTHDGRFWADTNDLKPADIACFGGKASNFGVLRQAIPNDSPRAMAFSFDLWAAFLGQSLTPVPSVVLEPGGYMLLWADEYPQQGPCHLGFKLSKSGEDIGLFDSDGMTLIDSLSFGPQRRDVSYGRCVDGGPLWQFFETPTPGVSNGIGYPAGGLVINEFMADNETTMEDPDESGEYPDWIELFNGAEHPVILNRLFLTDDLNSPTQWQIPPAVNGTTLGDEIASRLTKCASYPPEDMKTLSADLAAIRSLFLNPAVTGFDDVLRSVVLGALVDFGLDPKEKLRFRSSTNVEDSDQFTGAGLYESYSGCLADDLDDDEKGPCACDASDQDEDDVFRAIRKVFASFYNDNAFLERLKYGLNESQVGMALLVHSSFPDEIELANGVATMSRTGQGYWSVELASQKGAVSVTNPPSDVIAETVRIEGSPWGPILWVVQPSSLVSLREGTVLEWEKDYVDLYELLAAAADYYSQLSGKDDILLDLEYKKVSPDNKLVIKQVRQVPQAGRTEYAVPFLWGQTQVLHTLQGRGSNVFANHRLKSHWTLKPKSVWLDGTNLSQCLYDEVQIEYVADGQVRQIISSLSALPGAEHVYTEPQGPFDSYSVSDAWRLDDLCNPRSYRLLTQPLFWGTVSDPVVTLGDFRLGIQVDYAQPVPVGEADVAITEEASLYRPWEPAESEMPEVCSLDDPNTGVAIETEFYMHWSWSAASPTSIQLKQTRIEGLASEPIVLTGYFSQSVGGGSHLCPKEFLFEPQLEPGISPQILDELKAKNVRLIYYTTGARECRPTEWQNTPPLIRLYGFDSPIDGVGCLGSR
jgi:hypothetical protein